MVCIQITNHLSVPTRRRVHASMRGRLLFRVWAPTFGGSPPTTPSSHCPRGPLKWQVAELVMEGAHLQVQIVQGGHLLPATTGSGRSVLRGPAAPGLVEGKTQAQPPRPHPPPMPSASFLTPASSCPSAAGSWPARLRLGPGAGWSSGPLP